MTCPTTPTIPKPTEDAASSGRPDNAGAMDCPEVTVLSSLTPAQCEKVTALTERAKTRVSGPPMKLKVEGGVLQITYAHAHPDAANLLLMAELGTCDPAFMAGISGQVARIGAQGHAVDETNTNFLLSVVRAVEPRDELETMLAVQMGAIHAATMMMARRLNQVSTVIQQDAAERAVNKLARTYSMQMDALKQYRTGGQQKMTVEHVTVNAGGRAIVGAVTHRGGGTNGK